jgi:hypothetical protein
MVIKLLTPIEAIKLPYLRKAELTGEHLKKRRVIKCIGISELILES